jgi:regulatory protein
MAGEITGIKTQSRNRNRVNVYLDGDYGFSLGLEVAASLKRGESLSDDQIEELQLRDSEAVAYNRTLRYLGYRPRSTAEVRRYLRDKGFDEQVSDQVTMRLRRAGLLDDHAFAQYWVENRETFRPRGRRLLRQELRQKGIGEELVAEVLAEVDEESSAYRAAVGQAAKYARLDDDGFQEKMSSFLRRRGFDYEVVRATVSRLLLQRGEEGSADS